MTQLLVHHQLERWDRTKESYSSYNQNKKYQAYQGKQSLQGSTKGMHHQRKPTIVSHMGTETTRQIGVTK